MSLFMTTNAAPRKIRLLNITKSTGGLATYNRRMLTRLDQELFDIHVVCLSDNNLEFARELQGYGLTATPMKMNRYAIDVTSDLRLAGELLRFVRQGDYDVIIGHGSKSGFLARLVGRLAGVPTIYGLHTMAFVERIQGKKALVYRQLERASALLGGQVMVLAEATRNEIIRLGMIPAQRIHVIYTGVDLDDFPIGAYSRDDACRALGLDPARPVVGWAARLMPQKAPLDYLEVARTVLKFLPDAQFYMAGEGPLMEETKARIARDGLEKQVILASWQSNIAQMLAAFDVYALTSHWEGLPQSLLEAMAMGCACVSTDVDGCKEVIQSGTNGFLTGAGDTEKMADYTVQLLNDEALRRATGQAARQRIEAQFTIEQMIGRWEALLMATAQKRPLTLKAGQPA
jgi:L-malate glycosyltransferase